ncbi:hypothetical protein J0A71_03g05290 [Encephalitozoon cuniculi]|uniref:Uncharacterized protein n=1 Tax=Encephalitozoon cuniculi TaxID=6035 RepID=M1K5C7_ENCCN|nr:hypothetical protein ECU09_0160 [Encephalitozoon cuniculi]UYI26693.1 hypothetical protein J0A71_03g05290 [Encephalitozoon cuniculi]
MKNNESCRDDDDFWKILSESDDEYEEEIGLIFKSKAEDRASASKASDETPRFDGLDGDAEEVDDGSLAKTPCERMDAPRQSDAGEEKNEAIGEEQKHMDSQETFSGGGLESDRKDIGIEDAFSEARRAKEEADVHSQSIAESDPKISSVDEMDFLWDDDEEFIVGEMASMDLKEKAPSRSSEDPEAPADLEKISCTALEDSLRNKGSSRVDIESKGSGSEASDPTSSSKLQDSKIDLMKPKPLSRFMCGSLVTVFMSLQKRFNIQGEAIQNHMNVAQWHRLDYVIPEIKPSNFLASLANDRDDRYQHVYELVRLKAPCIDSISRIVSKERPVYCSKDINRSVSAECMNRLIELCIEDPDKAFEYAMENEIWELGTLSSRWTKDVGNRFLEKFCDSSYAKLISSMLGLSTISFRFDGDWKRYIREVLSTKSADVNNDFILQVFSNSIPDALFVVVSSYFLGIIDINKYLWMFSKNFEALRVLCYVEYMGRNIKDLDILKYEFVSVGVEFDRPKAEEYFKTNRKYFRKELVSRLETVLDTKWSFGLKSVFDFGIKKILNVDSLEDDPTEARPSVSEDIPEEITTRGCPPRNGSMPNTPNFRHKENIVVAGEEDGPSDMDTKPGKSISLSSNSEEGKSRSKQETVGKSSMYKLSQEEVLLKHDERKPEEENKQISVSNASCEIKERSDLHIGMKPSKSFADFFVSDKREPETKSEDDTSLFLSRFTDNEDLEQENKEKAPKKGGSFFGFLNVFRKEPVHKAKIDADDDFRYDPVEKKWVVGSSAEDKKGDSPVLKPRTIPKPKVGVGKSAKGELDTSVTSMYANRKSVGNRSIPGVLGKKE